MTSPNRLERPMPETPRHSLATIRAAVAIGSIACAGFLGCGEEEAPPTPVVQFTPPPPPPPPPEPTVKSIEDLMKELNIDPRVQLAEDNAPDTTEERVAVLLFWNAFAKGDNSYAASRMTSADRKVIEELKKNGSWDATTAKIESIQIECTDDGEGFATYGLITAGESEQPLLWDAEMAEGEASFTAFPGPADILSHLSGEDSIDSWKKYVNGLFEKYANLPDEEVEIPQTNMDVAEAEDNSPTPPSGEGGGAGGGGAPMRNRPKEPVRGPEGPSPGR